MPTTGNAAAQGKVKFLITALLLVGLMVGLAACRGFFGQAPIAVLTFTLPADGDQEEPVIVTFDISGSTDPDGTIVSWKLEYGDGEDSGEQTTDISTKTSLLYDYTSGGTFTATLTVTDNDGRIGKDTKIVVIGPAMLTFASKRTGNYGIYRMRADGTEETEVRNTLDEELFPDLVRGTRDKIAYAAEDGTRWNIFTMGVDGGALAQLTTQTPSNQIQPSWSYNGTKIAYASNAAQTPTATTWEIYSIPAAGGTATQPTTQTPSWAPAYSPKNNNIVFVSEYGNTGTPTGSALWFWNGSTASKLLPSTTDHDHRYGDASPAGFPTGLGTLLNLPTTAGISKPAWSPDGTKIAFSSDMMTGSIGGIDVWIITVNESATPPTYSDFQNLNTFSGGTPNTTNNEFCPYWLEDGSGLAFVREVGGAYHIYKVSFSDGSLTTLTSTGTNLTPASRR
ncbi:PD40 domain-containing protein [Candidatus Bipolaricaulota bacterium]|nr:PD40 domain-containing protein [Candidatus Bipolaricaulota bacterium]